MTTRGSVVRPDLEITPTYLFVSGLGGLEIWPHNLPPRGHQSIRENMDRPSFRLGRFPYSFGAETTHDDSQGQACPAGSACGGKASFHLAWCRRSAGLGYWFSDGAGRHRIDQLPVLDR